MTTEQPTGNLLANLIYVAAVENRQPDGELDAMAIVDAVMANINPADLETTLRTIVSQFVMEGIFTRSAS